MTQNQSETIHIIIRRKDSILWQGDANSFSSINEIGPFDILPEHSHFVGLIEKYIIVKQNNVDKKWEIEHGILSVKDGTVEAFLGY